MKKNKKAAEPFLTVSIVTYNSSRIIGDTLKSLQESGENIPLEIIIVDNSSADGTAELLKKDFPGIALIHSPNRGFGAGHNQALRVSRGKYHLILNPDITLDKNTLSFLLDFLEKHPEIDAISPLIKNPDGTVQHLNRRPPTLLDISLRYLSAWIPLPAVARRRMDRYTMADTGYERPQELATMTGCFMLYRSEVLKTMDGFDERFFLF